MIYLLLLITIMLESTVSITPLTLITLLVFYIVKNRESEEVSIGSIFLIAFLSGLLLDVLKMNPVGLSSLFFVVAFFLISGYSRKFEISTFSFVGIFSFIGAFLYLLIFARGYLLPASAVSALFAVSLYGFFTLSVRPRLVK